LGRIVVRHRRAVSEAGRGRARRRVEMARAEGRRWEKWALAAAEGLEPRMTPTILKNGLVLIVVEPTWTGVAVAWLHQSCILVTLTMRSEHHWR
jgi:hypothetical protein